MQTIGYIRVSTEEQAQSGLGLEAQERMLRAYCEAKGIALDDLLVDAGYSGKDLNRPGIAELLRRVRERRGAPGVAVENGPPSPPGVGKPHNLGEAPPPHTANVVLVGEDDTATA